MNFFTTLGLAFTSLTERPSRTILTSLGIIIGVAAVFAMLAIGEAVRQQVLEQANSTSTRTISAYPDWEGSRRSSQTRGARQFTERDVADLRLLDGASVVTGTIQSQGTMVSATADSSGSLIGVDSHYMDANDQAIASGEGINDTDVSQRALTAVIGQTVARTLFRDQNPVGQRLKINAVPFVVKGVAGPAKEGSWRGQDPDDFVLVPVSTMRTRLGGATRTVRNNISQIQIVGRPDADLVRLQAEVDSVLRRNREISLEVPPDFRLLNFAANIEAFARTAVMFSILLAAMGTISLIVGGVGVMNIMLVSVTERTREIGLRMAIGARGSDVMSQFLTEALMLCVFGGLVGLALGYSAKFLPFWGEELTLAFSLRSAILAFGSALLIGLVFGILPARRASRLNPIEALRHE